MKESVKIDTKLVAKAKQIKEETGVPISVQFEKAFEKSVKEDSKKENAN